MSAKDSAAPALHRRADVGSGSWSSRNLAHAEETPLDLGVEVVLTEVVEFGLAESPQHEGSRVHARRRVALPRAQFEETRPKSTT